jgi:hypothetical protein
MVKQLAPASVEDVLALERLSASPNAAALVEMVDNMADNQPLTRRIRAAEMLWKSGRRGKGMR